MEISQECRNCGEGYIYDDESLKTDIEFCSKKCNKDFWAKANTEVPQR